MAWDDIETKNAVIKSAKITNADHGLLCIWLDLDYGNSGQGFGGYALYNPDWKESSGDYAGLSIWRILEVVGVSEWDYLVGKTIRVKASHSEVKAIGHIVKDIWFNPSEEFTVLKNKYKKYTHKNV